MAIKVYKENVEVKMMKENNKNAELFNPLKPSLKVHKKEGT